MAKREKHFEEKVTFVQQGGFALVESTEVFTGVGDT